MRLRDFQPLTVFTKSPIFDHKPSRGVLIKMCSENMQPIDRRTPMPKCDSNKAALQL